MKIKLLSIIVAFILLFSVVVLGEERVGFIKSDSMQLSSNPGLLNFEEYSFSDSILDKKQTKTLKFKTPEGGQVEIDRGLLANKYIKIIETDNVGGKDRVLTLIEGDVNEIDKDTSLEEIRAIGKEVIPTIVLGKDTLVKIKEVGKSIQINIQHKDSKIFKKPIDQLSKEFIFRELSKTDGLKGLKDVSIEDINSINIRIKDGKYSVFLNGKELKQEEEEAIVESIPESVTAILGEEGRNVNVKKDGDTYTLRLIALSPETRAKIKENLEKKGADVSNFDKANLVRISKNKDGEVIYELKTAVETKKGYVRTRDGGFLTTKQIKTPKEFEDIGKSLKELGGELKKLIKFNNPKKIDKIKKKSSDDGYNRDRGTPFYTSKERRKIEEQKAFIINEEEGINSEKLDEILITVSEAYKTNLKDLATTEKELKELGFWKSFSKEGKQLREELKRQRSYVANNQIYLAALTELQEDEQIYASAPVNDGKGEIREYAGEKPPAKVKI